MWWRLIIACLTTYANALVSTSSILKWGVGAWGCGCGCCSASSQECYRDKVMHSTEVLTMVNEAMQNSTGVLLWAVQAEPAPQ